MRVVDASALVDVLLNSPRGRRVRSALSGQQLAAPELLDVEVLSAVARQERAGALSPEQARRAVDDFDELPVGRVGSVLLRRQAWLLRDRCRISDAFYAACAKLLDVPLLTTDGRLARAPLPGISVLLVR